MRNTTALLDRAKRLCEPPTDYQLAKRLGISAQRLSNWRRREQTPDNEGAWKIAEILGPPIPEVIAYIEEDRAKTPEERERWTARLPRLLSALAIAAWIAGHGAPQSVENSPAGFYRLYIMRTRRRRRAATA